jgi:long-subunit fatty acid transport protein
MIKQLVSILFAVTVVVAESPLVSIDGVGAKAQGMGNNYTAIANDYSAIFWNPSGLAFIPVREIHAGMNIAGMSAETELGATTQSLRKSQFRFGSAGLVRSIPTTQGGFAFAIGYSSPYSFMDVYRFKGFDIYVNPTPGEVLSNGDVNYLRYGDTLWYDDFKSVSSGGLGMWSAAAGWQVAEGLGIGLTASYLNGKQMNHRTILTHNQRGVFDNVADLATETVYSGFDVRVGAMYRPNSIVSAGARIEIPQVIAYRTLQRYAGDGQVYKSTGQLRSSLTGAFGLAITLPFATVTGDLSARSPNPDVLEGDLAYWKIGVGGGVEVPLTKINTILRAGYGWREYDMYPYADYKNDMLLTDTTVTTRGTNAHKISAGATFVLSKNVMLDFSYTNAFFTTETFYTDWKNSLEKSYSANRLDCVLAIRY